nr:DUF2516 family protein [Cellulomonas marina]
MIAWAQTALFFVFYLAIFVLSVVALLDLLRRPATAFVSAGKLTKGKWGAILGVATAVAFMALPAPLGLGLLGFLAIGAAVAAIVYLVDVKPAVSPYRGRGGGGGRPGGW